MSELELGDQLDLWEDMPDFEQDRKQAFATVIVRVSSEHDLAALSAALDQPLTTKTKSVWFPRREKGDTGRKRWI